MRKTRPGVVERLEEVIVPPCLRQNLIGIMNAQSRPFPMNDERHAGRAGGVDIGNEPPIEADGLRHTAYDHRNVSLRWLAGTILTGLSGAALIGAAIYAALDRQSTFAEAPVQAVSIHKDVASGDLVNPRKGDRLVHSVDIVAARQSFRTNTNVKVGDKEIVKARGFTRVSTNLALSPLGFADEVPAFNPLNLLSDARNPAIPEQDTGPVLDDAEVSFVTRDLAGQDSAVLVATLSMAEVQAQIVEHVKNALAAGSKPGLALPSQMLLMRTRTGLQANPALAYANTPDAGVNAPFSAIQVKMVAENVTILPKAQAGQRGVQGSERLVVVRHGETLEDVLRVAGVGKEQIKAVVAAFGAKRGEAVVSEGRRLKLLMSDYDGTGRELQLARLSVYADEVLETTIAMADNRSYVRAVKSVAAAKPKAAAVASDDETDDNAGGMRLYDSLFETALKQDIPRPLIADLVRIFANDVDFQHSVSGGDALDAFYSEPDEGEGHSELLYAAITTRNETFKYYRFQTKDDSLIDYYDENGRSTRKFLIRTPIANAKQTSPFGFRFHPILGYRKFHSGTDWAAPIGTPIVASGNGTVIKAAWDTGYGRRVEIQHANSYITTYNHMSGFAKGIAEGARVRQGQVIGYLGQTGLATGPHLHYEVMINGNFVDPLRVKLARTREFDGRQLADFKRERDKVEGLMARAPNATAKVADQRAN